MRYLSERKGVLRDIDYEHLIEKYDREEVVIYRTIDYGELRGQNIQIQSYGFWKIGSNLRKISNEVYGRPDYWWTIGLVNSKPTDSHFEIGDEILYAINPSKIVNSLGDQ